MNLNLFIFYIMIMCFLLIIGIYFDVGKYLYNYFIILYFVIINVFRNFFFIKRMVLWI